MTLFFPDLNVWLALSVEGHVHSAAAWDWLQHVPDGARLIFSRYTQLGLLRLLSNPSVMGERTLTLAQAWGVYDRWLADPRVELYPEPQGLDAAFRAATKPVAGQTASQWIGDAFLLAYAQQCGATLVTFDRALIQFAAKRHHRAVMPA
jgi:toxin-antitoxin system PIN domain toxin